MWSCRRACSLVKLGAVGDTGVAVPVSSCPVISLLGHVGVSTQVTFSAVCVSVITANKKVFRSHPAQR